MPLDAGTRSRAPRRVRRAAIWATSALGVAAVVLPAATGRVPAASASATTVLADWRMDEPPGATTMTDGGPNGIDGSIGSAVQTGVVVGGATAYRWSSVRPNEPPAKPERLVQVADARLNPGSGDYAVTMRFRTTRSFGNVIQKGQTGNRGGFFKWQIPKGKLTCLFRGDDGNGNLISRAVNSGETPLNDGAWHTVRCERTSTEVVMTIDGTTVRRAKGPSGTIRNAVPLTIGGKLNCDQITVTCDYFEGDIDWVRIEVGGAAPPAPSASPTPTPTPTPTQPPPPSSTTLFRDDFSKGFAAWNRVKGLRLDRARGRPSPPSALAKVSRARAFAAKRLPGTHASACVRANVRVRRSTGNALLRLRTAGNGPVAALVLDRKGRLRVRSDVTGARSRALGRLGVGWHSVRLCGAIGSPGSWNVTRDGRSILEGWSADTGTAWIGRIQIGDKARRTWTGNIDRVVVSTS
jgi:hypothetical protein